MATIEDAIFTKLSTDAGLSALIGDRIFPQVAQAGTARPYITFQKISGPREQTHEGSSNLAHPRFQFSCWDEEYEDAKATANALRVALDAFTGTVLGVQFQFVDLDSELDTFDEETKFHRVLMDFVIWHRE